MKKEYSHIYCQTGPVLVLGGTSLGEEFSQILSERKIRHYYSTKENIGTADTACRINICGALEPSSMAALAAQLQISCIIDASHPFAAGLRHTIAQASANIGITPIRIERRTIPVINHKLIHRCSSLEQMAEKARTLKLNKILVATGANTISNIAPQIAYAQKKWYRVLNRRWSVEKALEAGATLCSIIAAHPKEGLCSNKEEKILCRLGADAMFVKDSGYEGGLDAKIKACINTGTHLFILSRPEMPAGFRICSSPNEAYSLLSQILLLAK
jgi:precorrin-6A/cobalt-precorrin-6A reductase